jgi:hypothetical protein
MLLRIIEQNHLVSSADTSLLSPCVLSFSQYYKGWIGGVKNWTAMPSIFPHGLAYFQEQTQWSIIAHNRYWSGNTDYASQNGGTYEFIVDDTMHSAMPQSEQFWLDLFTESKKWGLTVYEQDWLYNELEGVTVALQNVTVAKRWLTQMATAAEEHGIFIQYCMPWSRHLLSSLQFPAVTQARASDDYQPGNAQWQIGYTSMLYRALGLAPFKDNFWTTQWQEGNPYGLNEPHTALESIVASLSTGPVTIGDALGKSNRALILKSCRADGRLLQPDVPLHYTDAQIYGSAFGPSSSPVSSPSGLNFLTWTSFDTEYYWSVVVAVNMTQQYEFTVDQLPGGGGKDDQYLVWSWTNATSFLDPLPSSLTLLTPSSPLSLPECGVADFTAYYIAPVFAMNGWAFLGEWEKWAVVSRARVHQLEWDETSISLTIGGRVGEMVNLAFAQVNSLKVQQVQCTIGDEMQAKIDITIGGGVFDYACSTSVNAKSAPRKDREEVALE